MTRLRVHRLLSACPSLTSACYLQPEIVLLNNKHINTLLVFSGMERISVETDWDGLGLSSPGAKGRNNISSFVTELNSLNISRGGGSLFGILIENGSNATSHTDPQPRSRDQGLARAEIAILGVVLALTTLGNSFVLWVLLRRRKYNAPMHLFMVNLCVADLVVALFQVSSSSLTEALTADPNVTNYSLLNC